MSWGTVMYIVTFPFESALKGKVWTTLHSWISPAWLAGTWVAVTVTTSPREAVLGLTSSVTACARIAHVPKTSNSRSRTTRAIATWRRFTLRFGCCVGVTAGSGSGMTIVAGRGAGRTRSATAAGVIGTVDTKAGAATGGALTGDGTTTVL